jgi:uncharacterized damage-inducible protein DinB
MTSEKDEVLRALYEEIAESIAEAPDAEIVEECKAEGESVEQVANHMRDVLRGAWKGFQQQSLREAREKYQRTTSALKATSIQLPVTAAERRQMFARVLARRPEVGKTIHMQFRDFDQISDEDVETCLQQFAQLGLLSDSSGQDE